MGEAALPYWLDFAAHTWSLAAHIGGAVSLALPANSYASDTVPPKNHMMQGGHDASAARRTI